MFIFSCGADTLTKHSIDFTAMLNSAVTISECLHHSFSLTWYLMYRNKIAHITCEQSPYYYKNITTLTMIIMPSLHSDNKVMVSAANILKSA